MAPEPKPTLSDLGRFLKAVGGQVIALICGGVIAAALAIAQGFGLQIKPGIYAIVIALCVFLAAFGAWFDEWIKTQGAPDLQIAAHGFYHESRTFDITVQNATGQMQHLNMEISMLHLRIINCPHGIPTEKAHARSVIARLYFLDQQDGELFFIDGRWGDTVQPPRLQAHQAATELLAIDIPVGQIRELDIACKFPNGDVAYGFNNDSYPRGMTHPQWRLPQGDYRVRVQLIGTLVNREWILPFRVGGWGELLMVLP